MRYLSALAQKIDWGPFLFLTLSPLIAFGSTYYFFLNNELNLELVALTLFFYAATALSITGGYHRLFAHKTYEAAPGVRWFYALFGAAAFQNSILKWATDHRIHHQFVDSEKDPYSISRGFWYAHLGWMVLKEPPHPNWKSYQRDLSKDSLVIWQDRYYVWIAISMGLLLPTLLGGLIAGSYLGGFAVAGVLRMVALHHGTFCINSLCHWWGTQKFTDTNSAKDNFVAALLTFGEGYHNFHHYFANDYRNGLKWYNWDPTKWLIELKALFGLAYKLKKTPEIEILKARLNLDAKKIRNKAQKKSIAWSPLFQQRLDQMRDQLIQTQSRMMQLKLDLQALRKTNESNVHQKLEELRLEWRHNQQEWQRLLWQWRNFFRSLTTK